MERWSASVTLSELVDSMISLLTCTRFLPFRFFLLLRLDVSSVVVLLLLQRSSARV